MPFQFTCSNCHQQFRSASRRERRFCSRACMYESEKIRRNHVCARCEVMFDAPASVPRQFCSRFCYATSKSEAALTPERFWSRVDKSNAAGCWPWMGPRDIRGYGSWGASHHRQRGSAHRRAWELTHGPIPEAMVIMHLCDNPPCCRPDHLRPGTHADNHADRMAKGRTRNGHGAPYARGQEGIMYFREVIAGVWIPIIVIQEIRLLPGTTTPAPKKYAIDV